MLEPVWHALAEILYFPLLGLSLIFNELLHQDSMLDSQSYDHLWFFLRSLQIIMI